MAANSTKELTMHHHAPVGRRSGRNARLAGLAPRTSVRLLPLAALILIALGRPAAPGFAATRPAGLARAGRAGPALQVSTAPLTISPSTLPVGRVGTPYRQAIL